MAKLLRKFVLLPGLVPLVFLFLALTPVGVFGCRTRGLLALMTAVIGGLAGVGTVLTALVKKTNGDDESVWWILSTLILALPAFYIVISVK